MLPTRLHRISREQSFKSMLGCFDWLWLKKLAKIDQFYLWRLQPEHNTQLELKKKEQKKHQTSFVTYFVSLNKYYVAIIPFFQWSHRERIIIHPLTCRPLYLIWTLRLFDRMASNAENDEREALGPKQSFRNAANYSVKVKSFLESNQNYY